ncbi:MAG: heat-inducible transcriptional repressor HrcA [Anaerolineaceae bacterium]|nr:heat-inducible transcriptional repressor HrcA [Chloroflexota bacterium]MCY4008638.1 heat-inducible transcriptional repressor HrcA [Anaerolineaceae bacterium]
MTAPEPNTQAFPSLTLRQEQILSALIRAYCEHPEAISSQLLSDRFNFNVSAATIRNEMSVLEQHGYIVAPHPSAGRIPTEKGYRYFVSSLPEENALLPQEQRQIERKFRSVPSQSEAWLQLAASMLASHANAASLVTPPTSLDARLKHVQLISIHEHSVLFVLVTQQGSVHQRMVTFAETLTQGNLSQIAAMVNQECSGHSARLIRIKATSMPSLQRDILEMIAELLDQEANHVRVVYRGGLHEILNSFPDQEGSQQALRVLEEEAILNWILGEFAQSQVNEVKVIIASEGRLEVLNRISLVLSQYGLPDQAVGTVGILGPTHLNYSKAISTVRYISEQLTELLEELYQGNAPA